MSDWEGLLKDDLEYTPLSKEWTALLEMIEDRRREAAGNQQISAAPAPVGVLLITHFQSFYRNHQPTPTDSNPRCDIPAPIATSAMSTQKTWATGLRTEYWLRARRTEPRTTLSQSFGRRSERFA